MSFSSLPMSDSMINASVNALFQSVGSDRIKTTDAITKRGIDSNYDGFIDKTEMKDAIKGDKVAISLKEYKEGGFDGAVRMFNSYDVASDVSSKMDKSDGSNDGQITLGRGWQTISSSSLTSSLVTGGAVIGREIQDRQTAKNSGLVLLELHQNKSGAKLVMGQ